MTGPLAFVLVPVLAVISTSDGSFTNFTRPNTYGRSLINQLPSGNSKFWKSVSSSYNGPRKIPTSTFQRSLVKLLSDEGFAGKQQKSAEARDSSGAIAADGVFDMEVHLDMKAFLDKIDRLPSLERTVIEINQKIDNMGSQIINEVNSQIANLQSIIARELVTILQNINTLKDQSGSIRSILEGILVAINNIRQALNGSGSGKCDLTKIETEIERISAVFYKLIKGLSDQDMTIIQDITTVNNNIQENYILLKGLKGIIEGHGGNSNQTAGCDGIKEIQIKETEILSGIKFIVDELNHIPETVVIIMEQNGLANLGGVVQQVIKICKQVETDISVLNGYIKNLGGKLLEWYQSQSRSIEVVKKTVVETTEIVRSSAKKTEAVLAASRKVKTCS